MSFSTGRRGRRSRSDNRRHNTVFADMYETQPLDPVTFAGMSVVLLAVGLIAAYLPARRAASLSPIEAMRGD
jgi:hypothetical protein